LKQSDPLKAVRAAMAHRVRARIYLAVADARSRGVTVRQVAERIEESPRRVRYHLTALIKEGVVGVAGERIRRGVIERSYRALQPPGLAIDDRDGGSSAQTEQATLSLLQAIVEDAASAVKARNLARPGCVTARVAGKVDEQGWSELVGITERALADVRATVNESEKRLGAKGGKPTPVVSALCVVGASEPFA
jgi:DNA-binding transcriptional ArsR family regulator